MSDDEPLPAPGHVPAPPHWVRDVDRILAIALRETPLLPSVTARGGLTRAEIVRAFEAGNPRAPGWTYAPLDASRARGRAVGLEAVAETLEARAPSEASLERIYAARARELATEALLAAEAGSAAFAARARVRFPPEGAASEAARLASEWITDTEPAPVADTTSDGPEDHTLVSRLREEIGRLRLPFRVAVAEGLAPLAATGDGAVWVTAGRAIAKVDVERTVLHEVQGHVLPRVRASRQSIGIFAIGTARGTDDQEGLAILLEERHGFLRGARRRELALRHRATEAMDAGATFVEVVRTLVERDGAPIAVAVAAAERAFRGSAGEAPGLGRERVYVAAFARVKGWIGGRPEDESVLGAGQVAVGAVDGVKRVLR